MPEGTGADRPVVGIVVVSYGSSALLDANLAAIDRAVLPPSMVVVVDNRTTDGERAAVAASAERHGWELLSPARNLGFGAGMNLGVRQAFDAGCDMVLLLNPDVVIDAAAIGALVQRSHAHPRTALSPRLTWPDGSTWFAGGQLDRRTGLTRSRPDHQQEGPDRWLSGACLLLDRSAWELVGGFDERYFLYWEDVDLTQRLLQAGGELLVAHDVVGVHHVGGTQRTEGKSPTYCRTMCRNRLLFATDHVDPRARVRWLLSTPTYATRVLFRHGRRAALRRPRLAVAAVWGSVAGVALVLRSLVRDGWTSLRDRVSANRSSDAG